MEMRSIDLKTIQDCILTKDLSDTFKKFSNKSEIPNLLLSGTAGTVRLLLLKHYVKN